MPTSLAFEAASQRRQTHRRKQGRVDDDDDKTSADTAPISKQLLESRRRRQVRQSDDVDVDVRDDVGDVGEEVNVADEGQRGSSGGCGG